MQPNECHEKVKATKRRWLWVMGPGGHDVLEWEETDTASVEEAMKRYQNEVLEQRKQPFRALDAEGTDFEIWRKDFDPNAEGFMLVAPLQGG